MNIAIAVCKAFIERSEELGYKGKARDKAALDYIIGAAKALQLLHTVDQPAFQFDTFQFDTIKDASNHLAKIAWVVSIRGYKEVELIANQG